MAFNMGFSKSALSGKAPLPANWYHFRLTGFQPKIAGQNKDSISLNPQIEVVGNPDDTLYSSKVFENLNTKAGWIIQDLVHACGLQMVEVQDGNQGTEAAQFTMPGFWANADQFPDEPEKWEYQGQMTNATFEAETYINEYNGRKSAKIRQYKCAVPGCQERHSTNLAG